MVEATGSRPNVLLVLTDQHAPKIGGFAGDSIVRTQHLDSLASRSVQFDTAICASPCCTPSRMTLLTGKDIQHCAGWANHWVIFPEHVTWPGHFAAHGYTTGLVGKMHFGGHDQNQGFQHRPYGDLRHGLGHQPDPLEMYPTYHGALSAGISDLPESLLQDNVVTRESLAFVREQSANHPDTPWFCCASYSRPHSPFTAPGRYIRRYRDRVPPVDRPADFKERMDPYSRKVFDGETGGSLTGGDLTDAQTQRAREAYYACVDYVDDCIGDLLDGLADAGLLANTIIIYTADHGEMCGERGMWGKVVPYEPSIGVPLFITGPGIAPGHHRVDQPVSLMDLFPTTAALAGLAVPAGLDGVDQSAVLRAPADGASARTYAPSTMVTYGGRPQIGLTYPEGEPAGAMRAIRTRGWKYVAIEDAQPLLFDMQADPGETRNVAGVGKYQDVLAELEAAAYAGFSWAGVHSQLARDRERIDQFASGRKPSTPNQYRLADGREFDAEASLYAARWLPFPPNVGGGVIPQRFG